MTGRLRLDAELVRRGLARSRDEAARLIKDGKVAVAGSLSVKPATQVETSTAVTVRTDPAEREWASRGAHKLLGALAAFDQVEVAGKICLDAGAAHGGFTDVLLDKGAAAVKAVDVGYGQLVWRLRSDERVTVYDRTNVRYLTPEQIGGQVELMVADVSFISLTKVLPAIAQCCVMGADLVPMVKPQFEVGKDLVGKNGVVKDPAARIMAIEQVATHAGSLGLEFQSVAASPLPGPTGNVEFFVWLIRREHPYELSNTDLHAIERVVLEGPP